MDDTNPYTHKTVCRFAPTSWSEQVLVDVDGTGTTSGDAYYPDRGFTRVEATYRYSGAVEGTSTMTYLIAYMAGGAAPVLGFERFVGSVDGHEGSFVVRHTGEQDSGSVRGRLEVVPGMGTGDLEALRGEADLVIAGHSEDGYELVLRYDLPVADVLEAPRR